MLLGQFERQAFLANTRGYKKCNDICTFENFLKWLLTLRSSKIGTGHGKSWNLMSSKEYKPCNSQNVFNLLIKEKCNNAKKTYINLLLVSSLILLFRQFRQWKVMMSVPFLPSVLFKFTGLHTNLLHHFPLWKVDFKFYFPSRNFTIQNGGQRRNPK